MIKSLLVGALGAFVAHEVYKVPRVGHAVHVLAGRPIVSGVDFLAGVIHAPPDTVFHNMSISSAPMIEVKGRG